MEDLSFTWTLDQETAPSFDDADSVRTHRFEPNRPASYKVESLWEGLSAYAAALECSAGCGAAKA